MRARCLGVIGGWVVVVNVGELLFSLVDMLGFCVDMLWVVCG